MSPRREVNMPAAAEPKVSRGLIAAILALVLAVGALFVGVQMANRKEAAKGQATTQGSASSAVDDKGTITVGKGPKVVDVYEDFQCPACGSFESQAGRQLGELATKGEVTVRYHLMTFLDRLSQPADGKRSHSTRAASAAYCAADAGAFQKVHDAIFAAQPANEGQGWTDEALRSFGKEAGLSGEALSTYESCVNDEKYAGLAATSNAAAGADGVQTTPTVKVDGKQIDVAKDIYADVDGWLASLTQ